MDLASFFTPEAGQARTRWLNDKLAPIGEAARYYLGPTGVPERAGAAGQIAGMFSPGADVVDAYGASGDLMASRSPIEAATAGAGLAAAFGSMLVPGNARAVGDAMSSFTTDESGALTLPGFGDGRVYRVEAPKYEHPGAGAVFYSPDPDYVANYFSPERVLRAAALPKGTLDIGEANSASQIMNWLSGEANKVEDLFYDGRLPGVANELRDIGKVTSAANPTPEYVARGLANLGLIRWKQGQPKVSGLAERELLDAFGAPAMTMRESDGSPSLAFRSPEIARQNWLTEPLPPDVARMFTRQ